MQIDVSRMPPEGEHCTGADEVMILEPSADDDISRSGLVKYDLHARFVDGELIVNGKLAVEAVFRCSRCAETFRQEIRENAFSASRQVFDWSESVDLTEEMREAILCAFPSHPVCSAVCKGLCANCGANLNKEKCDCRPVHGIKWETLDGLKL